MCLCSFFSRSIHRFLSLSSSSRSKSMCFSPSFFSSICLCLSWSFCMSYVCVSLHLSLGLNLGICLCSSFSWTIYSSVQLWLCQSSFVSIGTYLSLFIILYIHRYFWPSVSLFIFIYALFSCGSTHLYLCPPVSLSFKCNCAHLVWPIQWNRSAAMSTFWKYLNWCKMFAI